MKTTCVANQKGGVGKTTLIAHMAYAAVAKGLRVLLVDMDKQANLSLSFPASSGTAPGLVASQLFQPGTNEQRPQMLTKNLSIIRADGGLLSIDKAANDVIYLPGPSLRRFNDDFDLCLIDTPPLLGIRLMASLAASDFVVTPVSMGLYELAGVTDLMQTIQVIRTRGFNSGLKHIGILPTKTNSRSLSEQESLTNLRQKYGSIVLTETLPERAPVRNAIANRRPVWLGTKGAGHLKAAKEWQAACDSLLKRIGF